MTVQKSSWGYIRNTNISGYLTIEQLLEQLVSTIRYVVCVYVKVLLYVLILTQYWWQFADECGS